MRCITTFICLLGVCVMNAQTNFHETWVDPVDLCSNEPFTWSQFGDVQPLPPNDFESCIKPFEHVSKVWLRFVTASAADLAFTIEPFNLHDDIDFALYESEEGVPTNLVRCVATGILMDRTVDGQSNCLGMTGLSGSESDQFEPPGCDMAQNNFVNAPRTSRGQEYMLLITNYRSTMGFQLSWTEAIDLGNSICDADNNEADQLEISVNPNPATQNLFGQIQSGKAQLVNLYLVGANGTILEAQKTDLHAGANDFQLQISSYPQGHYYIFLSGIDGITAVTKFEIAK